jgi:hypothetical protein
LSGLKKESGGRIVRAKMRAIVNAISYHLDRLDAIAK